jgi:acetyltransferase AlgX (SGNH hydrolase-like protein)/GDSL-like lipase/acylhydrolase family protein
VSKLALRSGIGLVVLATSYCLLTAVHLHRYVSQAKPATNIASPPRVQKFIWMEIMLIAAALLMGKTAVSAATADSPQRALLSKSHPITHMLWALCGAYVLLVYYPLPPEGHHTDKGLLTSGLLLVWSLAAVIRPTALGAMKSNRIVTTTKLVLANLLIFIVLAELSLRLADPFLASLGLFGGKHTPAHLTPHQPVLGSIGRTNSHGFRDRERTFDRTNVAIRVLAIGDSQTYGAGASYDETFSTLLEKRLQGKEPRSEVINLGVSGWEPPLYLHLLKIYGLQFKPDLVLLNFYVGNDIITRRGVSLERPLIVAGQSYYVHSTGNAIHDAISPDRSFLYHHLNYIVRVGGIYLANRGRVQAGEVPWIPIRTRKQYLEELDQRTDIYLVHPPQEIVLQWEKTFQVLTEFRDILHGKGIRLLLVLLPDHLQVDSNLMQEFLTARQEDSSLFDFERPQRMLKEWASNNGVPTVDVLPRFRQTAIQEPLFYETDLHMKPAGHRLVGETVWLPMWTLLAVPSQSVIPTGNEVP